jgi:hypothetical protein
MPVPPLTRHLVAAGALAIAGLPAEAAKGAPAAGEAGAQAVLEGRVDSALMRVSTNGSVVVLAGGKPGGSELEVAGSVKPERRAGSCEWTYRIAGLKPGRYVVGFRSRPQATAAPTRVSDLTARKEVEITGAAAVLDLPAPRRVRVGAGGDFRTPSEAARAVRDGTVVEIERGVYVGDATVWRQNRLTLRGVGGRAHLRAEGAHAEGKAIWVIKGRDVVVENIEFSEATVPDGNGAGIRHEGRDLVVCGSHFHHNQNGILGGGGNLTVEYSEFGHNGAGDGYTHNLYITGPVDSFTLRHSYVHHARIGHNVKSRAARNFLLYNRIMDEADGTSSYAVDIPEGGSSYLIGNLIQQGPNTENSTIVSFGAERPVSAAGVLYLVNNTLVNDRHTGTFVFVKDGARAQLSNNLFVGKGQLLRGQGEQSHNLHGVDPRLVDRDAYDYRLTAKSPARDAGRDPGQADGVDLTPLSHYVHKASGEVRPRAGGLDVGAYEFVP